VLIHDGVNQSYGNGAVAYENCKNRKILKMPNEEKIVYGTGGQGADFPGKDGKRETAIEELD